MQFQKRLRNIVSVGLLRLLFAISVVSSHLNLGYLLPGRVAVELFFMTSGFLISGILDSKRYATPKLFILSRILRIYPLYLLTLAVTLIVNEFIGYEYSNSVFSFLLHNGNYVLFVYGIFVNIFIIGQDFLFFIRFNHHSFSLASNFQNIHPQLHNLIVVPQGWTLSLELYFYILYAYIRKHLKLIFLTFLVSILLRFIILQSPIGFQDPWDYRFFPLEIAFFVLGVMVFHLSKAFSPLLATKSSTLSQYFLYLVFILLILFRHLLNLNPIALSAVCVVLYIFVLPISAQINRRNAIDNYLGQLSYPIYITHLLIIEIFKFRFGMIRGNSWLTYFTLLAIILGGVISLHIIIKPIEIHRSKLKLTKP